MTITETIESQQRQRVDAWEGSDVVESNDGSASGLDGLPLLLPVPRVAKLLGISRSAAYRGAASGELPTTHLGGRVYIITAKLQQLLESA